MKKFLIGLIACLQIVGFATIAAPVGAHDNEHHNDIQLRSGRELKRKACENTIGRAIINVEQKVKNDDDSGVGGNAWATDRYTRHIKVFRTTTERTYCAIVKYDGKFVTYQGASPQNTGTVQAGIKGEMEGGYRATIVGDEKPVPLKPTHGFIGTYDYMCDGNFNCPGRVDWTTFYFDNVTTFDFQWWGWIYETKHHGTWRNACTLAEGIDPDCPGNAGDIF